MKLPSLQHPETQALWNTGLDIKPSALEAIQALPLDSVCADLETMARFCIENSAAIIEDESLDFNSTCLTHALVLHTYLSGSTARLDLVIDTWRMEEAYIDWWFEDSFLENLWDLPVLCGMEHLERLADFVKDETVPMVFARVNMVGAILQIGLNFPERRDTIVSIFGDLLDHFHQKGSKAESESLVAEFVIDAIADLDAREYRPIIKEMIDKGLLEDTDVGDWDDYLADWGKFITLHKLYPDAATWYKETNGYWDNVAKRAREWEEEERLQKISKPVLPIVKNAPKIGRNDPCTCGSGKKYKKCCGA